MKLGHALIIAAAIIIGAVMIAGSPLVFGRYEYILNPNTDGLIRVDKTTGEVERFEKQRGWVNVRSL
jgi:hypothetical protein